MEWMKIEAALGEVEFGVEEEKEVEVQLECWEYQNEFWTSMNWTKVMQIIEETGIDRRERRLMSKLYMHQSVKYDCTNRRREEELDMDVFCHRFYWSHTASSLRRKLLKG